MWIEAEIWCSNDPWYSRWITVLQDGYLNGQWPRGQVLNKNVWTFNISKREKLLPDFGFLKQWLRRVQSWRMQWCTVWYKYGNISHTTAAISFSALQNSDNLLLEYMEPQPRKSYQSDVHSDIHKTVYLKTEATGSSKTLTYFYHMTCLIISATLC